ncbi:hypothetical protein CPB83DRAFT_849111 [Crepidotus variabilis]|uniref:Uncharacterized protein n=1 Tax=Crepidotus variabilis TaxID=179855 RepID=A0A9P6ELX8_9AGAR|nr:hypothetical protein CPB83DRAFT_849111 [Crepidotus variabilis]
MTFMGGSTAPLSVKAASSLCRKILAKEKSALLLAAHVKRWRFVGPTVLSLWTPAFLAMYFEAMKCMINLTEFALFEGQVTKDMIKGWLSIPSLNSLALHHCQIEEDFSSRNLRKFKTLRLRKLLIQSKRDTLGTSLLNPWIDFSCLHHLQIGLHDKGPPLSLPDDDLSLVLLEVLATDIGPCIGLMKKSPKLKILRLPQLYPIPHDEDWAKELDSSHLPALAEIEAPWEYCLKLIPGRPITTLKLADMCPKRNPEILQRSASLIRYLKIPYQAYVKFPFLNHFSSLQSLEVFNSFERKVTVQEILNSIKDVKTGHPELRSLCISLEGEGISQIFDRESQEDETLKIIESTFPMIEKVELVDHRVRQMYYHVGDEMWERGSIC